MPKFVEGYADRLKVSPGAREVQVFDDALPGFGIRKFQSGRASYFVKFNVGTQQRRMTLGAVVRGNLIEMRKRASAILSKARLGQDAVAEKRAASAKQAVLLGELVPKYLKARESELRPRTYTEWKRYLENHWKPLEDLSVDAITRADIVSVIDDLERFNGKVAADRARTALSAFFAWCIDRGYCTASPTLHIKARAQNKSRSRVLTESELVEVWKACLDDDYGHIVKLLMLTGQRRSEIGNLSWQEVNIAELQIDLPEDRTKNGRSHAVPLADEARAILKSITRRKDRDLVFGTGAGGFGGWSKAKAELDARIAEARKKTGVRKTMEPWTLHDLRRSFVTLLRERRFASRDLVELIVNHVSGARAGVAGVYDRSELLEERRQTLDLWGAHVAALVAGTKTTCATPKASA